MEDESQYGRVLKVNMPEDEDKRYIRKRKRGSRSSEQGRKGENVRKTRI